MKPVPVHMQPMEQPSPGGGQNEREPSAGSAPGMDHRWLLLIVVSFGALIVVASGLGRRLTWALNATVLGIALLTIADASSFWSANNPSFFTVRSFTTAGGNKRDYAREDIQIGSIKAVLESNIVGIGGSLVTGSYWPWAAQAGYLVGDWAFYHWALLFPHGETEIAGQN